MDKMEIDIPRENNTEINGTESEKGSSSPEDEGFGVSERTFLHVVKDVHKLVYGSTSASQPHNIRGLPWKILVMPRQTREGNLSSLGFFLQCNADCDSPTWTCAGTATLRVIPHSDDVEQINRKISHTFHAKENDWGFSHFLSWDEATDPAKGYCSPEHELTLEAVVYADAPHGIQWDSKKHTGYVGLKNQGATCYMNSLLQTLFFTNTLRSAVYKMPTELEDQSVPLALQRVFYELQHMDKPVGTKKLTKSFGWESLDSFMQHDVQELCRVLLDNLESKMKGTSVEGTITHLLEGKMISYIKCKNVDYNSKREESYYDISLPVRNNSSIIESFEEYIKPDLLEGDNKFDAGQHGLQDAEKGVLFKRFPPVLHLQLMRFQYDPMTDSNVKINDKCEFQEIINLDPFLESPDPEHPAEYLLHAVLVHSGDNYGGHYVAYVNPKGDGKWFKFDDDVVASCSKKEAIYSNFGGADDANGFAKSCTNAYMLVYIRKAELPQVISESDLSDIPDALAQRFIDEREIENIKRKEKQDTHLFMAVTIITDEQFDGHQGPGLLDPDCVSFRSVKVRRDLTWEKFNSRISEYFGCPDSTFRIWIFKRKSIRTNDSEHDVWRPEPIEEEDVDRPISQFNQVDVQNFTIWLEQAKLDSPQPSIPDFNNKNDLLVFLRLYEPDTGTLCYCGHMIIQLGTLLKDLIPEMKKRAGWSEDLKAEDVLMFEDRHLGNCRQLPDLDLSVEHSLQFFRSTGPLNVGRAGCVYRDNIRTSESQAEPEDGAVIIFQKHYNLFPNGLPASKLKQVSEFFRDQANRQEVHFVNKEIPNDSGFVIKLNQRQHYLHMAQEVAKVLKQDPEKLQFFKSTPYNRDGPGQPVKSTETRIIEEIIYLPSNNRDNRRQRKKMYYQELQISISDFESKKPIPLKFLHSTLKEDEIVVYINKNSNITDVIQEVKNKLPEKQNSKLRVLEYTNSRIISILRESEQIDTTNYSNHTGTQMRHLRVEEVPPDQLEFESGEVLIQVCHFNGSVQSYYGTPILIKIKNQESIKAVRNRIREYLDIPDKDFSKWKLALVESSKPRYYSEDDTETLVQTQLFNVETRDGTPLVHNRIWIGLDHPNKQNKRTKPSYIEKAIKIHN